MLGAHVRLERDGLDGRVAAERAAVRLLTGVTHPMTSQRVVVTCRVRTHVTSSTTHTHPRHVTSPTTLISNVYVPLDTK